LFHEPVWNGLHEGVTLGKGKFEKMKDEFYSLRGYDVQTGLPNRKQLEELGLGNVADELENILDC
jgi:aldehyde:ferredoxin oxidoreductase